MWKILHNLLQYMKGLSLIIQKNLDLETMLLNTGKTAEQAPCKEGAEAVVMHTCAPGCVCVKNDALHMGLKDVICRTDMFYSNLFTFTVVNVFTVLEYFLYKAK